MAAIFSPTPNDITVKLSEASKALQWDTLKKLQAADVILANSTQISIPTGEVCFIQDVTASWLKSVLGNHVVGADLIEAKETEGHEGMTSRHRWQLTWNEAGRAASLPERIFFKTTPETPHLRHMLALLHMDERECCFYNTIGSELNGLVPKCFYARSYGGGRHMIILEDLEVQQAVGHWMGDDLSVDYARQCAVTFAKIHAQYWNSERFHSDLVWARPHCQRFGEPWQIEFFKDNHRKFLASEEGQGVDPYIKELILAWDQHCVAIWEYFDTKPPTVLHGDSHLGNVLEYKDGTAGWYDLQCSFRGYGYRDLSYFLMSGLTEEDRSAHERELFDLYTDTLCEHGVKVADRREAWLDYCLLAMDRFDSCMSSLSLPGGYGHARKALLRQLRTLSSACKEHDILSIINRVLEKGTTKPSVTGAVLLEPRCL